jgi:phosphate transport system substrate-binding protein
MQGLFMDLSETYGRAQPQVSFDVTGGGSALGLDLVESGQVEIGLVSWLPQPLDDELRLVPLGQHAIAIITHPANPRPNLPVATLRDIFNGKVLDWQVIGGPDQAVQVVSREDGSGTHSAFEALVMNGQPVTPTAVVQPGSQAVVDYVAQSPGAVGYVSASFASEEVHIVPVEGVLPTFAALQARQYPLRSDLALVVAKNTSGELEQFLQFVTSPAGRQIVEIWQGR